MLFHSWILCEFLKGEKTCSRLYRQSRTGANQFGIADYKRVDADICCEREKFRSSVLERAENIRFFGRTTVASYTSKPAEC